MAAYNIKDIKDKKKLINLANYGTAERRLMRPRVLIGAGEEKPFIEGDILDANATLNLIEDTYDKGRIFRSFSKEGKKIDKEIKELLEKTDENYEQLSSAIADNKEDADQKIDQLSSKVDNIESNIPNLRRVVDIQLQSVLDGTKTYLVTKQGDVQEQIQISDGEKGEQGEKGDPFTYEDFTPEQIEGLKVKGDRGISISSLEQTQTAYTSGGVNEFTVTLDDGTVSRWYVRNGQKGDATKIWVNANTVHSGYYDSDNHEIKLLNADGGIMSIIDATAFIKDGMISDAYVENGYIVIVFNTDAGQTPIMIPVTDIFDADDYYTKLDTDARIAEDVLVETQRAEVAELQLTDDLAQEVSDRLSGDTTLDTKIETETTRATTAEGLLDQRVTSNNAAILAETTRATNAEEALSDAIDAEESTRIQEIDDLQNLLDAYIQSNDAAVQAEITRATTAEGVLQDNIDAEETRATTAEQANATAISTETSRAQSAELTLLGAINTEASTRAAAITAEETRATTAEQALQDNIDAEEQRAIAAELDLLDAIDAVEQGAGQDTAAVEQALNDEISRATLAEQLISSNLSAEITRATNADNANSTAISNEVSRATAAEQQNTSDIDAIEALIPSLATSSNQLADKSFVNSSIATSTATFVGTFNNITDLYAVTTADANDYGYVITTDSAGNTKYNRYKYDGSQWDFEYALNNSSFTAEEWAAIQSGMTQALRIKLENLPSTAVTSVGVSVPTGLTITGSPITSSGTIAINFTSGYSIPTTSSLTNWDTAYGWGNHANANYVKSVKVGTTSYNPSSGIVSLPAYPTTLPASDVYSWAKASTKPSYTLDEVTDGSTRKLTDYLPLSGSNSMSGLIGWGDHWKNSSGGWNIKDKGIGILSSSVSGTGAPYQYAVGLHVGGVYWFQLSFDRGNNRLNYRGGNADTTWGWYHLIDSNNIGSQSVSYATSAGSVAWTNVSGRPTNVSSFTNDSGYVTSSIVSGYATLTWVGQNYLPLSGGTITGNLIIGGSDIPEGSGNLTQYASVHSVKFYRNGFLIPYQMDDTNDGGFFRVRGTTEDNVICEIGTWDDFGTGETIQFNYYPTTSTITPTYSITVPKATGTLALTSQIPTAVSQLINDSGYITSSGSISGNAATATIATRLQTNTYSCVARGNMVSGDLGANDIGIYTYTGSGFGKLGVYADYAFFDGKVGIGTSSPSTKLHVYDSIDDTNSPLLTITNNTFATNGFGWASNTLFPSMGVDSRCVHLFGKENSSKNQGYIGYHFKEYGSDNNYVTIGLYAADELVNITGAGNVGIGTASPSYKLDVNGEAHINGNLRFQTGSSGMYGIVPLTTSGWTLNLYTEGQPRITIKDEGNVGIGTTSPSYKLHVAGTLGVAGATTLSNNLTVNGQSIFKCGFFNSTNPTLGYLSSGTFIINASADASGSRAHYGLYIWDDYYDGTAKLQSGYDDGNTSALGLALQPLGGKVGVGYSGDVRTLNYTFSVNGDAAATNFYTTSDSSKKDNITSLSEHIRKFTLKETGKEHYGVIAQEVEEMFREGEEGSYTVNYNSILSYYIGLLENRVAELENKVKELSHG